MKKKTIKYLGMGLIAVGGASIIGLKLSVLAMVSSTIGLVLLGVGIYLVLKNK